MVRNSFRGHAYLVGDRGEEVTSWTRLLLLKKAKKLFNNQLRGTIEFLGGHPDSRDV